jgi:SAM-dependent methyltransferase
MSLRIPVEFEDQNPTTLARLQERHLRIVDANPDAFSGKRVIDLACNNGRWSFAALQAGAANVTGVEGRPEKVEEARRIFERLGAPGRYQFEVGDIYDWLHDRSPEPVDTVLCLGVFYHIMDHHRLMSLMARTGCQTIVIDSGFVRSFRNSVHVQMEDPAAHRNALPKFAGQAAEFAGFVSLGLMIQMAWNLGFNCRPVLWDPAAINDKISVQDYLMGRRFTVRLERTGRHSDPEWQDHWRPAMVAVNPKFGALFDRATHDHATDDRVRRPLQNTQFSVM